MWIMALGHNPNDGEEVLVATIDTLTEVWIDGVREILPPKITPAIAVYFKTFPDKEMTEEEWEDSGYYIRLGDWWQGWAKLRDECVLLWSHIPEIYGPHQDDLYCHYRFFNEKRRRGEE